jgi:limonene-1,2-epoxide hydrolase
MEMSGNAALIKDFCKAWSRLDATELASYFTEDGIYHNMPADPVRGRNAIETFIRGFAGSWTKTEWEILNLAEAGDVVFAERLDRTQAGERSVDLPCTGVFTIRDGKIACWRDYFDIAAYTRAMR